MALHEKLSLRHIFVINSICIGFILFLGCLSFLLDLRSAHLYNIENIEKTRRSLQRVTKVTNDFNELIQKQLPLRQLIAIQEVTSQQVKLEILRYVTQDEKSNEPLHRVIEELNQHQEKINRTWPAGYPQEPFSLLQNTVIIINDIALELSEISSPVQLNELSEDARIVSDELVEAITLMRESLDIQTTQTNKSIISSAKIALVDNKATVDNAEELKIMLIAARNKTFVTLGIVFVLACALQIIAFILLHFRMKNSLQVTKRLSEGDLTVRFDDSINDEIGTILSGFNLFIDSISLMIREIVDDAVVLAKASQQLSSISTSLQNKAEDMASKTEHVAHASEEMSTNLSAMASASEEMSATTNSISSTIEQMSNSMNMIATATEEMSVSIGDIAQNAREGATVSEEAIAMAEEAHSTMNNLGETAEDIGNVTEVIKGIADQTNLLALNASIEAAAAGDAGRGFAVVANEIKELATQSSKAAKDIASRIGSVQKSTQGAVDVISGVTKTINKISGSAGKIATAVEEQTRTANEISSNVTETTTGTTNIAASVAELAGAINDQSMNSGEVAEGANQISSNIHTVTQSAVESNSEANNVNDSAEELALLAEDLHGLAKRFKLNKKQA